MAKQSWKSLEDRVREIASLKWKTEATPQHIGGVDFDAVLSPSEDELILIEITEQHSLTKIREDCAKIAAIKMQKLSESTLCRGYIILSKSPTNSMIETGNTNKIKILTVESFFNLFFDYNSYFSLRKAQPFGSAFNPFTGEIDQVEYVPVRYEFEKGQPFNAKKIATQLCLSDRIVLVGDYGTGKSRCIKRVFDIISEQKEQVGRYVFAINLREHWGASSASEIIAGHLEELGLSGQIDNAMQIVNSGGCILLLDGVDEVGAQLFGVKRENRKSLRRTALSGVRKLIQKNKGGVLITSRSHYFDSDEEMLDCLGLSSNRITRILTCPNEFSDDESKAYLEKIGISIAPPNWLPRKPLVFQVLSTIDNGIIEKLLESLSGEYTFWSKFILAISEREAKIHGSLDPDTVRRILTKLADITREGHDFLGRISIKSVRNAYEGVTGDSPDEAGEQMLMRLCTLGRVSPDTPDRQFVDGYIVDGLRAEALIEAINNQDRSIANRVWRQYLLKLGWFKMADNLKVSGNDGMYKAMLEILSSGSNDQAYAEVLSILMLLGNGPLDGKSRTVEDAEIFYLPIGNCTVKNITISNCFVHYLEILPEKAGKKSQITIDNCQVFNLIGISSEEGMPKWITKTEVEKFESLSTANRIKDSLLTPPQIVLLAIIHKVFFQPGKGRKEQALLKGGYGQQFNSKLIKKILHILLREKIVTKISGDEGDIYKPVRSFTQRMSKMKSELTLSDDPLWKQISNIK